MSELVLSGPLLGAALVAALGGLVSFASPCVLPLVPGFLGYVGGMTSPGGGTASRRRLVLGALLFVLGFTAVFLAMSVVISGIGLALTEHQGTLLRVAGVLVLALGLVMLLQPTAEWRVRWRPAAGMAGAPLLGVAFGLGFSACTGPALAAIQTLGTSILPGDDQVGRAWCWAPHTAWAWGCRSCSSPRVWAGSAAPRAGCATTTCSCSASAAACSSCWAC
ncbi:cytochrome c biogenesis CcdA family protein [Ornithinimicrobium sp. CNJ-824]|uniref:cytochrome c biogenesis CcdA family protein n=1 Tax=Ornithinimicrobium sp. CNJ-824 TaxID=1904966 RepID=UPI0026D6E405